MITIFCAINIAIGMRVDVLVPKSKSKSTLFSEQPQHTLDSSYQRSDLITYYSIVGHYSILWSCVTPVNISTHPAIATFTLIHQLWAVLRSFFQYIVAIREPLFSYRSRRATFILKLSHTAGGTSLVGRYLGQVTWTVINTDP